MAKMYMAYKVVNTQESRFKFSLTKEQRDLGEVAYLWLTIPPLQLLAPFYFSERSEIVSEERQWKVLLFSSVSCIL